MQQSVCGVTDVTDVCLIWCGVREIRELRIARWDQSGPGAIAIGRILNGINRRLRRCRTASNNGEVAPGWERDWRERAIVDTHLHDVDDSRNGGGLGALRVIGLQRDRQRAHRLRPARSTAGRIEPRRERARRRTDPHLRHAANPAIRREQAIAWLRAEPDQVRAHHRGAPADHHRIREDQIVGDGRADAGAGVDVRRTATIRGRVINR